MGLAGFLSSIPFVQRLRGDLALFDLPVAMTGVRLGDRVALAGCSEPGLLPALGARAGLTGRAVGFDPDRSALAAAARAAEKAGVLVEALDTPSWPSLPLEAGSLDLFVVREPDANDTLLHAVRAEAARVLRPGGRIVVISPVREASAAERADRTLELLQDAGFRGGRVLAERQKLRFLEAMKPRA